jgi:prolyl 4-hydroxylase
MGMMMRPFLFLVAVLVTGTRAVDTTETCDAKDGTCDADAGTQAKNDCVDTDNRCAFWASTGECKENPGYMIRNCMKSCEVCYTGKSIEELIAEQQKEREENVDYDLTETIAGVKQEVAPGDSFQMTQDIVDATIKYIEEKVLVDDSFKSVRKECKNRHPQCAYWASLGECENNPRYMTLQCAPSCQTCDKIDFEARCPWDKSKPSILKEGDLNKLFTRLTTEPCYQKYEPTIHSSPPSGPWVVTLENLLTPEECDRLIELGAEEGYEISRDVGAKKFDGTHEAVTSSGRTSTNAWCNGACYNDTMTQSVLAKIENVTGVPEANSEYLQLLRYEESQFYHTHNDYIHHQLNREEGVRILTVFLYLNDVEEGGETDFPRLGITVSPKRGKAVIWPSVLNEKPDVKDHRTDHQAMPVKKGVKYGANAWLHQRNFKDPYDRGCV